MKVPSLAIYTNYIFTDKDGNTFTIPDDINRGLFDTKFYLEKSFNIKTSQTTISKGKTFHLDKFKYGESLEYMLAWGNWVLNRKNEEEGYFSEQDFDLWNKNNPLVQIRLQVTRNRVENNGKQ